jgi:hypothetical protein
MQALFAQAAAARRAGRYAEAEAAYRQWIAAEPQNPAPQYGLSHLLLARGAYDEGWALNEARSAIPETGIGKPRLSMPEWRGEPVASLLVWPEQGLGDQIMFARYIPALAARGIAVTLVCQPPLARLFAGLGAAVVPAVGQVALPRCDAWCLIGSLPHRLGEAPADPYLPGGAGGAGVGVMTSGNPAHVNDANRSLPPEMAARALTFGENLAPTDPSARDFQETAEIISRLSLVISVDTAIAHLAGAMGKPVWLLLSREVDWRWGYSGEHTVWYPSMRLFRQETLGDWATVLDRVAASLEAHRTLETSRVR